MSVVKASASELVTPALILSVSITKFGELAAVLNIPNGNETIVRSRDNILKLSIIEGERNWSIVTGLGLLLGLKEPEVDSS